MRKDYSDMAGNQYAKKPNDVRKSSSFTVRCTLKEREFWQTKAYNRGMGLNELVRTLLEAC